MKEIIKSLYSDYDNYNESAVKLARENKGKINDYLLKELEKINKDIDNNKIDCTPLFIDYAIFLLAEFKDKKLYPILMKLLNKPSIEAMDFFGTNIMDSLPAIVASVFDGNFSIINKVIENKEVDDYTRGMLLDSYIYFYNKKLITKEEIIKYLRNLIKLYNYEHDGIYNNILTVIIDCKLFEMIEDVKILYHNDAVEYMYIGGFDSFIDLLFNYEIRERIDENIEVKKMICRFNVFDNIEEKDDIVDKFVNNITKEIKENRNSKIGRNDPCPCGSGKKYKKCCLNKNKFTLPYQKYIDKSLDEYPKKNNNKDQVDFYEYYNQEYIEIDKLLYKALKHKHIPKFITRDINTEELIEMKALEEAFELIKEELKKNNFKNINEYDDKISIHYSLYSFFDGYSRLLIKKAEKEKEKYLPKLEELLDTFYQNFDLEDESEILFLDRKHSLYVLSRNMQEGIKFFEEKLSNYKYNKYDIYGILFDEYMCYYDYDEGIKKIDEAIAKESDKKLVESLNQLKIEFIDDEDYF